jgi:putative ABC transport system permease protein
LLSATGVYGVLGYFVTQRTHEIGVRMALGARRGHVVRLVLGQGMRVMAIGIGFGLAGAIGLTQFLRGLLYEVRPNDPITYVAVCLLLGGVGFVAGCLPAWRAMRIDPMVALRYE